MNDPQNPYPPGPPSPPRPAPAAPSVEGSAANPESDHRNKGKVARLPKAVRDQLNQMIDDGLTYAEIIRALGTHGEGLIEKNISTWKSGGHQAWVKEQQRLAGMRVRQEFAIDLVRENAGATTQQAAYQIAALNLCDLLDDFDPALLKETLHSDPETYTMLLNSYTRLLLALPKLGEADAECERRVAEAAQLMAKAIRDKQAKPAGLSDQARVEMEEKLKLM
jgi:hypothetical protein